jgi:hypothetical protein
MFRFFRQLRQRLLAENRVSKYLLYAVGEIVLVVIGILIALQINNWNEWRKDRRVEQEILQTLAETLQLNIETLESDIELLTQYNTSAQIVVSVLENRLPFVDSLAPHFHLARVPKFELSLSLSGYEQYKNKGFDILVRERVKDEVINYFESTFPKWFTSYAAVNSLYDSFIDYHVPLFYYKNETLTPIDIQSLYVDSYFLGWIRAYLEGRNTLILMEKELIEETRRVLGLVREALDEG